MAALLKNAEIISMISKLRASVPEPWLAWLGGIIDGEGAKGSALDKKEVKIRKLIVDQLRFLNRRGPVRQEEIESWQSSG